MWKELQHTLKVVMFGGGEGTSRESFTVHTYASIIFSNYSLKICDNITYL